MKQILKLVTVLLILAGLYLVFPPVNPFSEKQISVDSTIVTSAQLCKPNTVYVTERTREIHQREGYEFVVDDNCALLQKNLISAIQNDELEEVRSLISRGANAQSVDFSTFQPVFPLKQSIYRNTDMVRLLLDNGAEVNQEYCCCASCSTPLTTAIGENRVETVRLLLERGANVEYRQSFTDGEKLSPLALAIEQKNQDIAILIRNVCERSLGCRIKSRALRVIGLI